MCILYLSPVKTPRYYKTYGGSIFSIYVSNLHFLLCALCMKKNQSHYEWHISSDDSVPDGSIWRNFKDDVISLERNEDMSSSSSSSISSKKPPAGKALKIRLYPNSEEKLKWIGTACW